MQLRILLLMTLIFASQSLRAAEADETLTLDQAIGLAVQNNRGVKNAILEVEKAQSQVAANRTYRLPSFNSYLLTARQISHVDLRFAKGTFGTFEGVGPIPAEDTTIRSNGRFSRFS